MILGTHRTVLIDGEERRERKVTMPMPIRPMQRKTPLSHIRPETTGEFGFRFSLMPKSLILEEISQYPTPISELDSNML
jgi:hypothetical protein